jgi:hypothetical protein
MTAALKSFCHFRDGTPTTSECESPNMSRILFVVITVGMISQIGLGAVPGDEFEEPVSALNAANDIEWAEMTVRILDPEGNPVSGASVLPWALRAGRGHGLWLESMYGAPCRTTTDLDGETVVVFPHSVNRGEPTPVVQVSVKVSHSDFCEKVAHIDVPGGEVTMERGHQLRIAGVAVGSGQPLSDCHLMIENSESAEPEFTRQPNGWLQSLPIREERQTYIVVHLAPGKQPEFSAPATWSLDDPATLEAKVEVHPGVRLKGKLSDNVKRPIVRGHVLVWCGSQVNAAGLDPNKRARPIWWIESVPIAKDGSFEFAALPPQMIGQFYAFANNFISAQPLEEDFEFCCDWFAENNRQMNNIFRYGQVHLLEGTELEVTIGMEPAGEVRVKCLDEDGRPVAGVEVMSWPNQYMVGGGSTIFCGFDRASSTVERLRKPGPRNWFSNLYREKTNAEGEATLRNLPPGHQPIAAHGSVWQSDQNEDVEIEADTTTEIELTLHRKD